MKLPPKQLAYLAAVRSDVGVFMHQAFATLYPGKAFENNRHIDAITNALEQPQRQEPPPHHQSAASSSEVVLVSAAWPAFLLTVDPSVKVFCVSYSDELAKTIARDFRRIVEAPWYAAAFPHVRLSKVTEGEITTDQGGFRCAMSVHGSITGRGADLIIVDDPCRPEEAVSDKTRTAVNEWFRSTLLSRRDDKRRSGLIVVMQRLHVNDLTGFIEEGGDACKLSFPAIAERDETIALRHGKTHWRRRGDALQPEREDLEVLHRLRNEIGVFNFEAQYQQSPRTPDGALFKRKYFTLVSATEVPARRASSTASTAPSRPEHGGLHGVSIVYIDRGGLCHQGRTWTLGLRTPKSRTLEGQTALNPNQPVYVVVESAGSGISLAQCLDKVRDERYRAFHRPPKEDKVTRAARVLPWFAAGIYLVSRPGKNAWVEPYLNEFMNFPNGANDDQVDSLVQLLHWNFARNLLPAPLTGHE
jgi:hypothetical protein